MSTESTIDELESQNQGLPTSEKFSMQGTTETTETTVESTMNLSECSTYVSSPAEATCVAVIIGRNAPTSKSILITPSRALSLPDTHPPSRTSSATSTTLPTPSEGIENATAGTNSFDDSFKDSVCEQSPSSFQQGEELLQEQRLNVKFAPLPDVGPRKRRGMPLGVAARSRMVRRRGARPGEAGARPHVVATPMWTEEEMEVQRQRLAQTWENEREKRDYYSELNENEDPIEDPITALGRLVKVAGKHLWNKIGSREGRDEKGKGKVKEKGEDDENGNSGELPARYSTSSVTSSQTDRTSSSIEERSYVPDGSDKENGTWEENVSKEVPPPQLDNGTVARKRSLWRRTRTASKTDDNFSPIPGAKTSIGKGFIVRSLSGRKSDAGKSETEDGPVGLRRSLSL